MDASDMADKARILLVDDDPSLLKVLSIRLQREGYDVWTAESGKRALAALPAYKPHVVITDMRMDGMDGLALFDAIHAREPTDRKSTRLNSSHVKISYAVFCLKKKKN